MKKNEREQRPHVRLPSILGIIICVILIPMLAMNLTIIIKSYINPDKAPDFFGIMPVVVLSGSMEPEILTGDLAILKRVEPAELKVNDIIAYKDGNSLVTHRIVELADKDGEPAFRTRGDANNASDRDPVAYSQVEGIYVFRIARLGHLAMFMQTPLGILVFVGVPLCCFILYDIIRRRQANQKEKASLGEAQAEIERLRAELTKKPGDAPKAAVAVDKIETVKVSNVIDATKTTKTTKVTDTLDIDLIGADPLGLDMLGIDLSDIDLSGIDLTDIDISDLDLTGIDLAEMLDMIDDVHI